MVDLRRIFLPRKSREMRRVFTAIYKTKAWGDCESTSGPGSTRERAADFLDELIRLVRTLNVSRLLDVPCGDFNWTALLADSVDRYIGVDVVPELINENRGKYGSPGRTFVCRDMVAQSLPQADLVLCRDGLVHLSFSDARAALSNMRGTGAEYLIATTFTADRTNADIKTGEWYPMNLEQQPFCFPAPIRLIDERCYHSGGIYKDKCLGLWRFSALPPFGR